MRYVSTRGSAPALGFDDVLLQGLAADGGLYVPEMWPRLDAVPPALGGYGAVAATVIAPYVTGSVVADDLVDMAADVYARFRHPDVAPLHHIEGDRYLLELFWGPTLSFKDYALQLVGRMFERVLADRGERITVLGATSGDTGSAAIAALAGLDNVQVVILYPEGRVSEVQRRQMTTVAHENVRAVAVEGTFDDCQDLVKAAFGDSELRRQHRLAAVNSINWARVMCQAGYYVWVASLLDRPFAVSVPTGNFGNVLAADVARRMGAPIERMIVANNANHGLATLIETGRLDVGEVTPTFAPAMDIQVSSNLERYLFELYGRDGGSISSLMGRLRAEGGAVVDEVRMEAMRRTFTGSWIDDAAIEGVIASVYERTGELIDPHTATGWAAADLHAGAGRPTVVVATAHPAKFGDVVERATGVVPQLPPDLADIFDRPERTSLIAADPGELAAVLAALP
jgi:threonine synthase